MSTSQGTLAVHKLPIYNTSRLSDEEVIAAFVGRRPLFERIFSDIVAEAKESRAQHHLIVGQRGMGKTMLLARLAAELRKPEYATRFVPLVFAEEQYSVDRLSKFWMNCLDSLADAFERAGILDRAENIDAVVRQLQSRLAKAGKADGDLARESLEIFAKMTDECGARPVLLVDNLQLVFERISGPEQHVLRELLQRPGAPIVVGATPTPPPQTQDYGAAFFDLFKVHYLRALSVEEMQILLLQLADMAGKPEIRNRVQEEPERLKVIRQLTAGNPRTTVLLFLLYAQDFSPNVFNDLENLLDAVTPLYKARFEELPPQLQVVASAVANHWDPINSRQLGEITGLPPGQISSSLDRLQKLGFVEEVELWRHNAPDPKAGYQIAERFFNIWFLMRNASRRQRREVELLTRFLEAFYEAPERERLALSLQGERCFSPDRLAFTLALSRSIRDPNAQEELKRHAHLDALHQKATAAWGRLSEILEMETLPSATLEFNDLRQKIEAMIPADSSITPEKFANIVLGNRRAFTLRTREKLPALNRKLTAAEVAEVVELDHAERELLGESYSADAVEWLSNLLATGQLRSVEDIVDWERAFATVATWDQAWILMETVPLKIASKLGEGVISRVERLFLGAQSNAVGLLVWARFIQGIRGPAKAQAAFLECMKKDPKWPVPLVDYVLSIISQGRFSEAEEQIRTAIQNDPEEALFWHALGIILEELGRYSQALDAYQHGIEAGTSSPFTKARIWVSLGALQCEIFGNVEAAEQALRKALEIEPKDWLARSNLVGLLRDYRGELKQARAEMANGERFPMILPDRGRLARQNALLAAYDENWGRVKEFLDEALAETTDLVSGFPKYGWCRVSAVLLHLGFGKPFVEFLRERGEDIRLRPWFEAVHSFVEGGIANLQNIAPEVRATAEWFYRNIESVAKQLPNSTKKAAKV
jgi:Flp pilus assembly protein TadD